MVDARVSSLCIGMRNRFKLFFLTLFSFFRYIGTATQKYGLQQLLFRGQRTRRWVFLS